MSLDKGKNFDSGEMHHESESLRELRAFKGMVEAAGGLERVASSVLEHTGVAKVWVYNWYNNGQTPSTSVTRQIFSELRHLVREAKANPQPEKEAVPEKPESGPVKPPVLEKPKPAARSAEKAKPKLTRRELIKKQQEARLMKDEEYAALHRRLVEKGLITPSGDEEK
ncbi:MAG: disks large-associated family protein [Patescibacteria group bacterium]|nr:disks large-associated family protein [Patescibacteria group bacterium]